MASVSLASIAIISVGCIGETVSTSTSSSPSWYAAIIFGAAAGLMAVLTLGAGRWFIRHTFVKHDLSALAYLGSDENVTQFANAPLYPDNQRFYLVGSKLLVNNDPRDVLGFVVGKPRWLESPPNLAEPGYYAYVVINWEYSEDFKRWVKRGFGIQVSAPTTNEGEIDKSRPDNRHLVLTPFNIEDKRVIDICEGWLTSSLRWRPYAKFGFTSDDIDNRSMSWQTRTLILIWRLGRWLGKKTKSTFKGQNSQT